MPLSTPVSQNKTAALSRVLDSIPKGYTRYTSGAVVAKKATGLAQKLHDRHGIGRTPAQRITRKKHGRANALLVLYWPEGADRVEWLMLFTAGELDSPEQLLDVTDKRRLTWLNYELVRHSTRGTTSWTWRRPKQEMSELHALLAEQLTRRHYGAVTETLQRIARQPGFHGVRTQSWALCQEARRRGYPDELPHLFYVQKLSHGDRLSLTH